MKLKTVRVRRSHPSALSAALALMLTMLFVYLISLSSATEEDSQSAASAVSATANVRMEALSVAFELEGRYGLSLEAQVAAANCAQAGGAGLILPDGEQYAVVRAVSSAAEGENILRRSADGLTLQISGSAAEIAAITDAVDFLRAQATETGSLAQALENGDVDAATMETLLELYRTRAENAFSALQHMNSDNAVAAQLSRATQAALSRLQSSAAPTPSGVRLIQTAACAQWIALLEEFAAVE